MTFELAEGSSSKSIIMMELFFRVLCVGCAMRCIRMTVIFPFTRLWPLLLLLVSLLFISNYIQPKQIFQCSPLLLSHCPFGKIIFCNRGHFHPQPENHSNSLPSVAPFQHRSKNRQNSFNLLLKLPKYRGFVNKFASPFTPHWSW